MQDAPLEVLTDVRWEAQYVIPKRMVLFHTLKRTVIVAQVVHHCPTVKNAAFQPQADVEQAGRPQRCHLAVSPLTIIVVNAQIQ